MISNYEKPLEEKSFSILVFRPFHIPIKDCLFVLHLTLRDLPFSIWHFQGEVTAIAGRKQILAGNMVMMPHLVIGFGKISSYLTLVILSRHIRCTRRPITEFWENSKTKPVACAPRIFWAQGKNVFLTRSGQPTRVQNQS